MGANVGYVVGNCQQAALVYFAATHLTHPRENRQGFATRLLAAVLKPANERSRSFLSLDMRVVPLRGTFDLTIMDNIPTLRVVLAAGFIIQSQSHAKVVQSAPTSTAELYDPFGSLISEATIASDGRLRVTTSCERAHFTVAWTGNIRTQATITGMIYG